MKRTGQLTTDKPLTDQVRLVSFEEGAVFETLHAYVHQALGPYLVSAVNTQRAGTACVSACLREWSDLHFVISSSAVTSLRWQNCEMDCASESAAAFTDLLSFLRLSCIFWHSCVHLSSCIPYPSPYILTYVFMAFSFLFHVLIFLNAGDEMGIKGVKKAVADMELSLQHLQQNVDIPEINIQVHPKVKDIISQASAEGRKPSVQDLGSLVDESDFLNQLQKGVARWIREMQKVTRLDRDPASGTTMQEVSFWLNLERALHQIKDKRDGIDITLTLDVLKHGKRFHATVSFDSDTGLQKALETVNNYNPLMKDFPLNGLLSASDTEQIKCAVVDIFSHMKKIRNTKYPITRALKLVQAISRDLNEQLLKVLGTQRLMYVTHEEFDRMLFGCKRVFDTWEEEDEKFRNILRDLLKRKRDDTVKTFRRVLPEHRNLQERLEALGNFRKQHEQLRTVIVRVLKPASRAGEAEGLMAADDVNAIEEVNLAYEDVKTVDPLDLSEAGNATFEQGKKRYDERIDRVETRITAKLRDQLGTAKNANEMFRIFSKFNALFVRPRIRGAIREYQTQLIQRVKADIETLHEKFKVSYHHTLNAKMSELRDLPPVSGHIIWARQIDRQLSAYLLRVEDVLGRGWENHVEGRALKEDGDSFRHKLDTQPLFEKWSAEVQARQLGVSGRIFDIELKRGLTIELFLSVNFHSQIITLSKEVRNLKWLGFRVPLVIVNKALQANHLYPFAISLKASVRTYQQTLDKLSGNESVRPLVASYHKAIQTRIAEGVTLRWESYRLENFVQSLAEEVFSFQEKVDDLLTYNDKASKLIQSLEKAALTKAALSEILNDVQKIVDHLNLKAYVNLDGWVKTLDQQVENKLVQRLENAVVLWNVALHSYGEKEDDWDARETGLTDKEFDVKDLPAIAPLTHEVLIRNQVMFLSPPAEHAMENLLSQFQKHIATITSLDRIQTSRYVADDGLSDLDKVWGSLSPC